MFYGYLDDSNSYQKTFKFPILFTLTKAKFEEAVSKREHSLGGKANKHQFL